FLDSLVAGVRHVEMALAVDRHPVGPGELAGVLARAPEPEQELAVRRECLDPIVQAADPHAVPLVHEDPDRPEGPLGESRLQGAEPAGFAALVAPGLQRLPLGGELLHPAERPLGGVDPAQAIPRQEVRPAEARALRLVAAELAQPGAVLAPLAPKRSSCIEHLDAMI